MAHAGMNVQESDTRGGDSSN